MYAHFSHFYQTGGSVYVIVHVRADDDSDAAARYQKVLDAVLSASLAAGGNTSHHHGVGRGKVKWLENELGSAHYLLRAVKSALDASGTLNPGVLGLEGGGAGAR